MAVEEKKWYGARAEIISPTRRQIARSYADLPCARYKEEMMVKRRKDERLMNLRKRFKEFLEKLFRTIECKTRYLPPDTDDSCDIDASCYCKHNKRRERGIWRREDFIER